MLLLLVLLFIVVPIAELAVIIQVGQADRRLVDDRAADRRLAARLVAACARRAAPPGGASTRPSSGGRVPTREVLDGVLVIFGGALLLTPGFITDILGLVLLFPPTRALVRGDLRRAPDRAPDGRVGDPRRAHGRRAHYDVEGTAVDVDADRIEPRREAP